MKIALVQMSVSDSKVSDNVKRAEGFIREAAVQHDPDIILLPEMWSSGFVCEDWAAIADNETPSVLKKLVGWSEELDVSIGGSMITRRDDGELANRFYIVAPTGDVVEYDKIHLFPPMQEPEYLAPGDDRVHVMMDIGSVSGDDIEDDEDDSDEILAAQIEGSEAEIDDSDDELDEDELEEDEIDISEYYSDDQVETSLSICYDLRFPAMYRASAREGAELFLNVAAWPKPRGLALRTLATARAIENQAFLALCNRVGLSNDGLDFCGGSMVVSPLGEVLLDLGETEGVGCVTIDHTDVADYRNSFDVLAGDVDGIDTFVDYSNEDED